MSDKRKRDKLDFKIKNFYASADTIKKGKIQPKEWEQILANHIADEGFVHYIRILVI